MKKALLVISFGTSYAETCRKNIRACEQRLAEAFPDRDLFSAFTSEMIIAKLARRDGLQIDNPRQALMRLAEAGYQDVLVQSLHIINGDEFDKVAGQVQAFAPRFVHLSLGLPLLSEHRDFDRLIEAMLAQCPRLAADERVIFMGHGATHHAFAAYACLDHMLMSRDLPVAGDHAINDMAADDEDSWKGQLARVGIEAQPWLQGLGENPLIQQLFLDHLQAVERRTTEEAA